MDQIKLLLQSTGLSADDLIKQLAVYKELEGNETSLKSSENEVSGDQGENSNHGKENGHDEGIVMEDFARSDCESPPKDGVNGVFLNSTPLNTDSDTSVPDDVNVSEDAAANHNAKEFSEKGVLISTSCAFTNSGKIVGESSSVLADEQNELCSIKSVENCYDNSSLDAEKKDELGLENSFFGDSEVAVDRNENEESNLNISIEEKCELEESLTEIEETSEVKNIPMKEKYVLEETLTETIEETVKVKEQREVYKKEEQNAEEELGMSVEEHYEREDTMEERAQKLEAKDEVTTKNENLTDDTEKEKSPLQNEKVSLVGSAETKKENPDIAKNHCTINAFTFTNDDEEGSSDKCSPLKNTHKNESFEQLDETVENKMPVDKELADQPLQKSAIRVKDITEINETETSVEVDHSFSLSWSKLGMLDGSQGFSSSRIKMSEILQKRLTESDAEPAECSNDDDAIEESAHCEETSSKRFPLLGCIRKRHERFKNIPRVSKPPWLLEQSNDSESAEVLEQEEVDTNTTESTREKIFRQLQQLRQKKETGVLVDIVNAIPKTYAKRAVRSVSEKPDEPYVGSLGIKITEIRGGVSEADMNFPSIKEPKQPKVECPKDPTVEIINDNLETPLITVTKTKDYKQIKGWKMKKLLINKDRPKETKPPVKVDEEPVPCCSYAPEVTNVNQPTESNVFASNNLDGFLDEQKSLNISYDVPHLTSQNHVSIDPLDATVLVPKSKENQSEYKRRVVAAEVEEVSPVKQNSKSEPIKPRTLAEKRKLLQRSEYGHMGKMAKEDIVVLTKEETYPADTIYSSVIYRGKSLKVPARYEKNIKLPSRLHRSNKLYKYVPVRRYNSQRFAKKEKPKPSIYQSKPAEKLNVTYKPGPLSRKVELQRSKSSHWRPVLKTLPRMLLEVTPEFGKPICSRALQFVKFETCKISPERLEFALSAVRCEPQARPDKKFVFPLKYQHNQNQILMHEYAPIKEPTLLINDEPEQKAVERTETDEEIETVVHGVLDGIINCVENRELDDALLQFDEDFEVETDDVESIKIVDKKNKTLDVIRKGKRKTNLELKRLSVKVIEVNIEDDKSPTICSKSYCKFGCVCKSLNSITLPQDHCGETGCMFDCNCGYERTKSNNIKVILPHGTDILNERTVNRLQDEAKKNLAKEEKEFTQTVIHANNQTIVVGDKADRKKRASKHTKRYQDYIESSIAVEIDSMKINNVDFDIKYPPKETGESPESLEIIPCSIKLDRIDMHHIRPFCLEHNLYDCYCNFESNYTRKTPKTEVNDENEPALDNSSIQKRLIKRQKVMSDNCKRVDREVRKLKIIAPKGECARCRGIPTRYYLVRNQASSFKKNVIRKLKLNSHTPGEALTKLITWTNGGGEPFCINHDYSWVKNEKDLVVDASEGPLFKSPTPPPPATESPKTSSRRKQTLQTREDHDPTVPLYQTIKLKVKASDGFLTKSQGGIYTPTDHVSEKFAEILGRKTGPDRNFRLLQWSSMMERYVNKSLQVWFAPNNGKLKFIITDSSTKMPPNFKNIREFETIKNKEKIKVDLVRWIVTRGVPDRPNDKSDSEESLVILKMCKKYWEVCGICAKNSCENRTDDNTVTVSTPKLSEDITLETNLFDDDSSELIVDVDDSPSETDKLEPGDTEKVAEKTKMIVENENDKYKTVNQVVFSNACFSMKTLLIAGESLQLDAVKVALPSILPMCKWCMLKINSNFAVLSFSRNQFRIKCSDIITVTKVAQRYQRTIIVNTDDISENYAHKLFGIYVVPNYADRIFVGPYFDYENHDLETLRYVNNVLISTEKLSRMQGTIAPTIFEWYKQSLAKPTVNAAPSSSFIDLTESEEVLSPPPKDEPPIVVSNKKSPRSVLKSNLPKENSSSKTASKTYGDKVYYKKFADVMRKLKYPLPPDTVPIAFTSNIKCGVIYGYQYLQSDEVFVYWPSEKSTENLKTFSNVNDAIKEIKTEISAYCISVPSFNIEVSMVLKNNYTEVLRKKVLDYDFFEDVHLAGPFGIVRMMDATDYLTQKYTPEEESGKDLKKFSAKVEAAMEELTLTENFHFLEFTKSCMVQYKDQISDELELCSKLTDTKASLTRRRCNLLLKRSSLMKDADPEIRQALKHEFAKEFPQVSKVSGPPSPITECEVICLDSDDETDNTKTAKPVSPQKETKTAKPVSPQMETKPTKPLSPQRETKTAKPTPSQKERNKVSQKERKEVPAKKAKKSGKADASKSSDVSVVDKPPKEPSKFVSLLDAVTSNKNIKISINKRRASADNSEPTQPKGGKKPRTSLNIEPDPQMPVLKPMVEVKLPVIERIDLSHISTQKIRALLGANLHDKQVTLTSAQLNCLKALSEKMKSGLKSASGTENAKGNSKTK